MSDTKVVRHKDGDLTNNDLNNLDLVPVSQVPDLRVGSIRWNVVTAQEAAKDADDEWQMELDTQKIDRYSKAAHGANGSPLRRLYNTKVAADQKYHDLVETMRRYQDPEQVTGEDQHDTQPPAPAATPSVTSLISRFENAVHQAAKDDYVDGGSYAAMDRRALAVREAKRALEETCTTNQQRITELEAALRGLDKWLFLLPSEVQEQVVTALANEPERSE